jgi:hypothetical protein
MNDTNNDNKTRFSITTQGLYFHNRIDKLRNLTTGPEVGNRLAVKKYVLQPKPLILKLRKATIRLQNSVTG